MSAQPSTGGGRDRSGPAAAGARPIEVELKYLVTDPAAGHRYLAAERLGPFSASGPVRTTQIEDRYVDSAGRALWRAGYAARLRRGPKGTVVTLKSRATVPAASDTATRGGGADEAPATRSATPAAATNQADRAASRTEAVSALHRREELEGPADIAGGASSWPASIARSVVLELCGDAPLVEIVTVRQLRQTRALRAGRTKAELSFDEVEVIAGGRVVERFQELEIEHRSGDEAPLGALAAELGLAPGLAPSAISKLERATAALEAAARKAPAGARAGGTSAPGSLIAPGAMDAVRMAAAPAPGSDDGGRRAGAAADEESPGGSGAVPGGGSNDGSGAAGDDTPQAGSGPAERPALARNPGVTAEDTLAEAGRKVLRFHYARMLARETGTRSGDNAEDLHGMRVATRRMRAAWRVFGAGFRPRRTRRLRSRLRVVAGRLGAVRDLDVLIEGLEQYLAALELPEAELVQPLLGAWRAQRDAARSLLLRELDSPEYATLVDEYAVFVRTEGEAALPLASPTTPHRVRDTAPAHIWAAYGNVRAYERVLPWADLETVHQLRIAGKWLRYTLEFFREALGPETPGIIARVVALQDHLGLLHDADVAAGLARAFLVEHAGTLGDAETAAIGRYLRAQERERARLRRSFGPIWRAIVGPTFRRGLGRAVAAL